MLWQKGEYYLKNSGPWRFSKFLRETFYHNCMFFSQHRQNNKRYEKTILGPKDYKSV